MGKNWGKLPISTTNHHHHLPALAELWTGNTESKFLVEVSPTRNFEKEKSKVIWKAEQKQRPFVSPAEFPGVSLGFGRHEVT